MKKINKLIFDLFKWDYKEMFKAALGTFLFCIALNIFIVPMGLYNGGGLGLSQLIRTLIVGLFSLDVGFDIAGILNYAINIPLFILAYKSVSKTFFSRTLFCVSIQTIFLTIIPVLETPIIPEILTSVLIGGIIAGVGGGMTLSAGASGGGTDIVGIVLAKKNRNFSVGKLDLAVNVVIYGICGALYGLSTMIYSIIYSVFYSIILDNRHEQNVCSTAVIFTKKHPSKIIEFAGNEINRGSTTWEAKGGYDDSKTYITYVVLSKYELQRLERHLNVLDPNAFMVKTNGVGVKGNFEKYL